MPSRLSARTSLVAEVATIRGFAPAALYRRAPPRKATLVDRLRKRCPTRPRLRRRIDRCLMSPAREPLTSATGPLQTAAPDARRSDLQRYRCALSASFAVSCRNLPLAIRRFIT
jgi:hypothetical protein